MRLLFLLVLVVPSLAFAGGPRYRHDDPKVDDEFRQVYHDVRTLLSGDVRISSVTISTLTVTSAISAPRYIVRITTCSSTGNTNTTSSSFQDTSLVCGTTPLSATNKIMITAYGMIRSLTNTNIVFATLAKDSTNLATSTGLCYFYTTTGGDTEVPCSMTFYDLAGNTTSRTYKVQIRNSDNTNTVSWNNAASTSMMTLIEYQQ